MPELMGISHVDLTVSDCERAAAWWQDVMGFTLVNRTRGETFETRSLLHSSGVVVTAMTHDRTVESGAFENAASALITSRSEWRTRMNWLDGQRI
jgi:glyoxylase I family protein